MPSGLYMQLLIEQVYVYVCNIKVGVVLMNFEDIVVWSTISLKLFLKL